MISFNSDVFICNILYLQPLSHGKVYSLFVHLWYQVLADTQIIGIEIEIGGSMHPS